MGDGNAGKADEIANTDEHEVTLDVQGPAGAEPPEEQEEEPAPGYGNGPDYWDNRYKGDLEPFEWLENYTDLESLLEEVSGGTRDIRILHVGCGNSLLTEQMYDAGYLNIINLDTSAVVIEQMVERNRHRPEMQWLVMDAIEMTDFADGSFDLVLDKSVLDTFACTDSAILTVAKYLREVSRVLRPGGTLFCVTYGAPEIRLNFLRLPHLEFKLRVIEIPAKYDTSNSHHVYICRKPDVPGDAAGKWSEVLKKLMCSGTLDYIEANADLKD